VTPAPVVAWFRRDLRLGDNPMLEAASAGGAPVVGLFVADPALLGTAGEHRLGFLAGCLDDLDEQLGGRLVVREGDPVDVVARVAAEAGATAVHVAEDFGPYGRRRDGAVARALADDGVELVQTGSPYAVAPGRLRSTSGGPYRVFTPFHRAWAAAPVRPAHHTAAVAWADGVPADPRRIGGRRTDAFPPGERAAHDRLAAFLDRAGGYDELRDRPDVDGTSRLSPYLKFGCLHPRQVLDALATLGADPGAAALRRQLCWRDFYADVLFHQPASTSEPLQPRLAALQVDDGPEARRRFDAWAEGRTGYPLVDAGMRQLEAEGWMPNRVRMIVASFLVKDLHLPWQWGERELRRRLVDADVASNAHGWQWVAGTGTDAAPYHRVFNPTLQARRHDPDGSYIRRWVPELVGVPAPDVHEPWTSLLAQATGYPGPLVDHADERREALERLAGVPALVTTQTSSS
jgi:deoxyribodipyrimidine photo-lyase